MKVLDGILSLLNSVLVFMIAVGLIMVVFGGIAIYSSDGISTFLNMTSNNATAADVESTAWSFFIGGIVLVVSGAFLVRKFGRS